MTQPDALSPRRAAARAICDVLDKDLPLDMALEAYAKDLDPRDRAFARHLAATVFRRFGHVTLTMRSLMDRGLKPDQRPVEVLIRLGLVQIFYLDVPDHAAVDTTVRLVGGLKHPRHKILKGLANAVLRRAIREREALSAAADANPEGLMPRWYRSRLEAAYGAEAGKIAEGMLDVPPLDLTIKAGEDAEAIAAELGGKLIYPGRVRLTEYGAVPALPGFKEGKWWVQDLAASLAAPLLDAKPGEKVADLCAAPGGKTMQLAATGADVLAVDQSEGRLKAVKENLARVRLKAQTRAMDARTLDGDGSYDAILIDAPCSATGTMRRHPEAIWIRDTKSLMQNVPVQDALLDKAYHLLKPGGRMVYCTCSLEKEEGEARIAAFLDRTPEAKRQPVTDRELSGHSEWLTPEGDIRTLPSHLADEGGMDGFFVARISKPA